jgi:hypothetical protein
MTKRKTNNDALAVVQLDHEHAIEAAFFLLAANYTMSARTGADGEVHQRIEVKSEMACFPTCFIAIKPAPLAVLMWIKRYIPSEKCISTVSTCYIHGRNLDVVLMSRHSGGLDLGHFITMLRSLH